MGLTTIQTRLLKMLSWFHNVCIENGFTYFLVGGSMLGAARHNGFIPWDDDIDICMPRQDYEKFNSMFGNKSFEFISIETHLSNNIDFVYGFTKIYDLNSTIVEASRVPIKRGIFIDVFPLDGCFNKIKKSRRFYKKILRQRMVLSAINYYIDSNVSKIKKLCIKVFWFILGRKNASHSIINKIEERCKKINYEESVFVANYWGAWGAKEIIEKSFFGKPTMYKFETIQVYGVERYDEYLTALYGDWRKLPPVEKRISHHNFLEFDLDKSFLDN